MAKRRGHGEGSITLRKRGRKPYQAFFTLPNGKRTSKSFATKREANEWLAEMRLQTREALLPEAHRMTFQEFVERWLETVVKPSVRIGTYERNYRHMHKYVLPVLGNLKLQALRPDHIQALYAGLKLHPNTIHSVHGTVHSALEWAVRWRLLSRNVADMVKPPREVRREIRPLDEEEARRFLEAARNDRHKALWYLALMTGMRRGELLGLHWDDVDLERGTVSIRRSLQYTQTRGLVFEEPKTFKSRRLIPISAAVIEVLKEHREEEMRKKERFPNSMAGVLVFTNRSGGPLHPMTANYLLERFLKRAGLRDIRFHDLRHTSASLLLKLGVNPKVVQERLGHANISLTLDTYSHILPGMQEDATQRMESALLS